MRKIKNLWNCMHCKLTFSGKREWSLHRARVHDKPYACFCGKRFGRKWDLKIHKNIHTNSKEYTCKVCSKGFADPSSLRRHEKIHSEREKVACSICGVELLPSSYALHFESHLTTIRHSCSQCPKVYKWKTSLAKHIRKCHPCTV